MMNVYTYLCEWDTFAGVRFKLWCYFAFNIPEEGSWLMHNISGALSLDCDAGVVFGIPQELSFSGFSVSFYI